MKKKTVKKIILSIVSLLVFACAMLVLTHTAQNGRETTKHQPVINDSPVYVTCEKNKPLEMNLHTDASFTISGFEILLVNLTEESRGTLQISVKDSKENILSEVLTPVETITPGEWYFVPAQLDFEAKEDYQVSFLTDGSEPYFMQVPDKTSGDFPFTYEVIENGKEIECGISFGVNTVVPVNITFGDIFYYSIPFCVIALILANIIIWLGTKKLSEILSQVLSGKILSQYGNDLFLLLLFSCICIGIISHAYFRGVYITADSTGYLREAQNLVAGNGFSYDGLAGYRSWFANWPIIYPAMIAIVMMITHVNAYLASKIVSMIIVAAILLLLRLVFKKDAWMYSLALTNIGFISLTYYTWSEIPFILFLLWFGLAFAKVLCEKKPTWKQYLSFSAAALICFLTRYFGIYLFIVIGFYLILLLLQFQKEKDKMILNKVVGLTISSFTSGILCMLYLFINKLMNGKASGVSRGLWWDDYQILTNDLIETLLKEIFNAFSIQVPQIIDSLSYGLKVFFLLVVLLGLILFIKKTCKHFTTESVLITMAAFYYVIFIVIRYRSSMDSFYFRFFEPATFIFSIALIGLVRKKLQKGAGLRYFAGILTAIIALTIIASFENGSMKTENVYYDSLCSQWNQEYAEIPQKSVIIFSDQDFRSSYYRPDVISGTINQEDSYEDIKNTYYGSDYLCIRKDYAKTMIEDGDYQADIKMMLTKGLQESKEDTVYLIVALKKD